MISLIWLALTASGVFAQNNALTFDGINDHVYFSTSSQAWLNTTITIEAWIKTTSSGVNCIVSWGNSSGSDGSNVQFRTYLGKLEFGSHTQGGSWQAVTGSRDINNDKWTHVAV